MARRVPWRLHAAAVLWAAALVSVPAFGSSAPDQAGASSASQDPARRFPVERFTILQRTPRRLADLVMPVPSDNPMTDAKTSLGRQLFFDRLLSADRSVSCATCHDPDRGFADTRPLAVGIFGRVGKRHSPAIVNRGFGRAHFWDGRAGSLEAQVLQPISDRNEMDLSVDEAVARLAADASYRDAFQSVFGQPPGAGTLGQALATYLRSIRSSDSPYDRFIDGQADAMTAEQQLGLQVFRSRGRCLVCHTEPTFTNEAFENTGVAWRVDPESGAGAFQDDGRFDVTKLERDRGKFKTPTLREIARTAPYMHDGSLPTLADVVEFYDQGGRANPNLMRIVRPLGLSPADKQALVKFLEALSGTVSR
jgi:cytochrome c peroxidase